MNCIKDFFFLGFHMQYLIQGIIVGLICSVYAFFRLGKVIKFRGENPKTAKSRLLRFFIALAIQIMCFNIWSNATLLIFYFTLCSMVSDIVFLIISGISKRKTPAFYQYGGIAVILLVIVYAAGIWNMNHYVETDYQISSDKVTHPYKVAFLSDIHYGSVQDKRVLRDAASDISALYPDVVILGGDIVDERTTKENMREVCEILGNIKSRYGVFYIYGNHDRQFDVLDRPGGERTFSDEELQSALSENGITMLVDSCEVMDEVLLIGRDDVGWNDDFERKSVADIIADEPQDLFMIVADHQPVDTDVNSELGVDMSISGHTHGGQVFPYPIFHEAMGILNYGEYRFGGLTHITSSGLTGWGWPLRNAYHCEYVVVDIVPN